MLLLVTMAESDPTPVSSIRTIPPVPSAPPATTNPDTSTTLQTALPSASAPMGEVTRAQKGKARAQILEAPPVAVINAVAGPSNAPYGLRSRSSKPVTVEALFDDVADALPTRTTALPLPPDVVVPSVRVQEASPPKAKLPFSEGDVGLYVHFGHVRAFIPL